MKKLISIALALALIPLGAAAQSRSIKQLAEKYSGRKGFTAIIMQDRELERMEGLDIEIPELVDIYKIFNGISSIIIVGTDHPDAAFTDDVNAALDKCRYFTLLSIHQDGQQIKALLADLPSDDTEKELILLVLTEEDNLLVSIVGQYKVKKISKQEEQQEQQQEEQQQTEEQQTEQ